MYRNESNIDILLILIIKDEYYYLIDFRYAPSGFSNKFFETKEGLYERLNSTFTEYRPSNFNVKSLNNQIYVELEKDIPIFHMIYQEDIGFYKNRCYEKKKDIRYIIKHFEQLYDFIEDKTTRLLDNEDMAKEYLVDILNDTTNSIYNPSIQTLLNVFLGKDSDIYYKLDSESNIYIKSKITITKYGGSIIRYIDNFTSKNLMLGIKRITLKTVRREVTT